MSIVFETERLNIRPFTLQDAAFIIELVNSEGWLKYIGDRNIKNTTDAEAYLANGPIKSYAQHNFGLWMVERKNNQTPIVMCGLIKRDTLPNPDIGFAFLPAFEKQGYAFEAICMKHVDQIIHALNIKTSSSIGSWNFVPRKKKEVGAQIDLLIDRNDKAITLCEIKYTEQPFLIDKQYADSLKRKISIYLLWHGQQLQHLF